MRRLPNGLVTFMFTDIEGSTRLHQRLGDRYVALIAEHDGLLSRVMTAHGGVVVTSMGDGLFVAFGDVAGALEAALEVQQVVAVHHWPDGAAVRVRIGLHSGLAEPLGQNYVALAVHQAARVSAVAHGGQVVATDAVLSGVENFSHPVTPLGEHRLKDFDDPVMLHQIGAGTFPPLATISNTNLPRPATSFIGRDVEVAEIVSHLRGSTRLLSLTGPGGAGKTRLAIEAAAELVGHFKSGVFWVDLSQVREPDRLVEVVGATLGAQGKLSDHVGERDLLLVLDNVEQIVAAAPRLAELVEACPNLRLLVTSRERLRVRGEVAHDLPPLAPADAALLFSDRSGVEADDAVHRLCQALDNLPLGLELAAARVGILSVGHILERLGSRLDAFKGGRDADPRQLTMRATIEWSHDLLDVDERALFAALAVFAGSATLEAIQAVTGADLDDLQSLVDKSLLRHNGERFRMLQVIRDFALERLAESANTETLRRSHALWYMKQAESVPDGTGPSEPRARLGQQLVDIDNFRAALEWALEQDTPCGLDLADALFGAWRMHGRQRELAGWYRRALARWPHLDASVRAQALTSYGRALIFCDEHLAAAHVLTEAIGLHRQQGNRAGEAGALNLLGSTLLFQGDRQRGLELFQRALKLFRQCDDGIGVSASLHHIGETRALLGDYSGAVAALEESVRAGRDRGDSHRAMTSLHSLGDVYLDMNNPELAQTHYLDALRIAADHGDLRSEAYCLAGLACVAAFRGDVESAGKFWGFAQALEEQIGQPMLAGERSRYERALAGVNDEPEFQQGASRAQRLSTGDAVEAVLKAQPASFRSDSTR